jgi:tetratricopeptide (TPR) repeat protein
VDASLIWTALGTAATCCGLWLTWRQVRMQARSALDASHTQSLTDMIGISVAVPVGRLPTIVRGRDDLLKWLSRSLRRRSGEVVVLAGMGGVGKSTVAAAFADHLQRTPRWRRIHIWWVPAVDRNTLTGALVTVARQLAASRADINAIGSNRPDAPDQLWALLNRTRRSWLLIFDNADEPAVLGRMRPSVTGGDSSIDVNLSSVGDGTGWVRAPKRGLVLITSRESSPAVWGRHARIVKIEPLAEPHAARVLLDRAPAAGDDGEAGKLARRLGGLPLVLSLVGSYLGSDVALRTSFRDYRFDLDRSGLRCSPLFGSGPAVDSIENARSVVMYTWEISLDALDRHGVPQARSLLRLLSCYASATPIPFSLLAPERLVHFIAHGHQRAQLTDEAAAEQRLVHGLSRLKQVGLIDVVPGAGGSDRGVVVHPVVADTNRSHLLIGQDGEVAALVRQTAVELMVGAIGGLDAERAVDWPGYLALGPHLYALFETVAPYLNRKQLDELAGIAAMMACAVSSSGAASAAEWFTRVALDALASLPDDDPIRLPLLQELAWPIAKRGQVAYAEDIYRSVFVARRRILGDDHPQTLRTRHELAWVAAAQGRLAKAEAAYKNVLDDRRRILGSDDPDTLMTCHELGWVIASQNRFAEAESILLQVLDARRRILGDDHPRTLKTRQVLAWATAKRGRWAEAEAKYRDLLRLGRQVFGLEHHDFLALRHEFAWVLAEQNNHTAALAEYRDVYEARRRVLGDDHPDTVFTRQSLEWLRQGQVVAARHLA